VLEVLGSTFSNVPSKWLQRGISLIYNMVCFFHVPYVLRTLPDLPFSCLLTRFFIQSTWKRHSRQTLCYNPAFIRLLIKLVAQSSILPAAIIDPLSVRISDRYRSLRIVVWHASLRFARSRWSESTGSSVTLNQGYATLLSLFSGSSRRWDKDIRYAACPMDTIWRSKMVSTMASILLQVHNL
jgi:hypothetical protein